MSQKYKIIYADPPWTFKTYSEKGKEKKSPELHYDCMSIEDIYSLPVNEIADENSVLLLWVTNPMLEQGLETIRRWGFTYKTVAFSWFKQNKKADSWFFGLGYWTRQNTEHVLLATKGKPSRINKGVSQIIDKECLYDTEQIVTRIQEHSRKPQIVREKIEVLFGDLPRIELFARGSFYGWDVWGNEAENPIDFGATK